MLKDLNVGIFSEKSFSIDAVRSLVPPSFSSSLKVPRVQKKDDELSLSGLLTATKRSMKKKKKLRKYVSRNISKELIGHYSLSIFSLFLSFSFSRSLFRFPREPSILDRTGTRDCSRNGLESIYRGGIPG